MLPPPADKAMFSHMKWLYFLLGVMALGASGCADKNPLVGGPTTQVVQSAQLPAPGREDLILQQRSYLIGPFDKVAIDVYGVPELTRTVQVDASGRISLPLVGDLEASGNTPSQLAEMIKARLRERYVRDPQVIVNADTVNQTITVDGEVERPGLYPVFGRMTLMRAIATAQGVTEFAATNYVVVFRRVNNQNLAALYDLRAIRQAIYEDPEVYANDVVLVNESRGRRVFHNVIQSSPLLVTPLVALLDNQ